MVRNDSDGAPLTGNDRFRGLNVDVIKALSSTLNFRYELYVVGEGASNRRAAGVVSDKIVRELEDGVSMFSCTLPMCWLSCDCIVTKIVAVLQVSKYAVYCSKMIYISLSS